MSQETILANTEVSFKDFLFKNKRNRTILWIAAVAIVIQFAVFKYFYPFPSFIHGDSFSYLDAAYRNSSINTYLIGYSNFLRLISVFTRSDFALTALQYLLIQTSALFFLFTIFYYNKISKAGQIIIFLFTIFNPLFLHLGNMISSDGYFFTLSMVWISLLVWIINRPSNKLIVFHAIVLYIAFTTRYNAMIYPVISIIAFGLSQQTFRKKIIGLGLSFVLCAMFIGFTTYKYKKLTGYWQYSPFSGWQWANNAMYAYRYVNGINRKPVPKEFLELDKMIRLYFDSTRNTTKFPTEAAMASTYYMWSPGMPLMRYRDSIFRKRRDTISSEFKKWASMGPLYKDYGIYIIKKYPFEYLRYFIWPNTNKYYAPPVEFLKTYNSNRDFVLPVAVSWFGYKSDRIKLRLQNKDIKILDFYPFFSGAINIVMLCLLVCSLILKGWRTHLIFFKSVLLGGLFWILNAGFTIVASSAALRFQSFPLILACFFATFLIDWMVQLIKEIQIQQKTKDPNLAINEIFLPVNTKSTV